MDQGNIVGDEDLSTSQLLEKETFWRCHLTVPNPSFSLKLKMINRSK